jgi:hypothetical protein
MTRRANDSYEAKQNAASKKVPPAMERTSKRRGPGVPASKPVAISKPDSKPAALTAVAEECDEWDPKWLVEPAK